MAQITTHLAGTPCWIEANVETSEQRVGLMDFYSALFGWTWVVGGAEMGFYSIANLNGSPVMGIGHGPLATGQLVAYFTTTDVSASSARAALLGAEVFLGPTEVPGAGSLALVLDPTGALHGLWQANTFAGFGVADEPGAPGWFDHHSQDPAAAAAYYAALSGHDLRSDEPDMAILAAGDQWFASFSGDGADRDAAWSPIYVADDLARVHEVVRRAGGVVVVEEMAVPGSSITVFVEPVMHREVTVMLAGAAS
jgi:hypothetical protein